MSIFLTTCRQVDHQYEVFRYAQYLLLNSSHVGIPTTAEIRVDKGTKCPYWW